MHSALVLTCNFPSSACHFFAGETSHPRHVDTVEKCESCFLCVMQKRVMFIDMDRCPDAMVDLTNRPVHRSLLDVTSHHDTSE